MWPYALVLVGIVLMVCFCWSLMTTRNPQSPERVAIVAAFKKCLPVGGAREELPGVKDVQCAIKEMVEAGHISSAVVGDAEHIWRVSTFTPPLPHLDNNLQLPADTVLRCFVPREQRAKTAH